MVDHPVRVVPEPSPDAPTQPAEGMAQHPAGPMAGRSEPGRSDTLTQPGPALVTNAPDHLEV